MRFNWPFLKLNQVILIIIFAQFIFTVAANLNIPFFAVYILDDIGAAAAAVGFASAAYWVVKSVLQLPIARWIDHRPGELDDYHSMIFGAFITTISIFMFYFATEIWQVFAIQILIGIGDAFYVPPFFAIFTRHIDKNSEGFEWSLQSSFSLGAGSALGGALSGILISLLGIRAVYLMNGTLMLVGVVILLFLRPFVRPRTAAEPDRILVEPRRA